MPCPPSIKRYSCLILLGLLFAAGDLPARVAALLTSGQPHGLIALADDDGGGDGGDGSDSDGGDSDGDADSDDDGAEDAGDSDDGEDDAEDDEDDDDVRGLRQRSVSHGAGSRSAQRQRRLMQARRTAAPATRAAAELVASGLDEPALARLAAAGYRIVRQERMGAGEGSLVKLRIPRRVSLERARRDLAAMAPRSAVDFNHYYRPDAGAEASVSSCHGATCFAVELIGWPQEQAAADCGHGVRIGVIDTAINGDHPALKGHRLQVVRLDRTEALPASGRQHGTAVASLLLGSAESRAPGLLPASEVIAVDAFHRMSAHDTRTDVFDLVRSLDMLARRGVQAINMSLSGPPNALLERAVARLAAGNIVLVAAAGNRGPHGKPLYPAAYDGVIAVTAVDRDKAVYRHANQGDYIDLAAPGVDVWTAASIRGARPKTGTSFAAPFVTAVAAVVASRNPDKSSAAVRELMAAAAEDLGEPGRDRVFGWGLVNARDICATGARSATE